MAPACPSDNTEAVDQSSFWSSGAMNWDAHRIGWAVAGACAALTVVISLISVWKHCRNYTKPNEQRQILRILYMPPVYAVISFFSYRYFRSYTYYSLVESAYEALTLSAFLLLLIEYVAGTTADHNAVKAIERKDKRPLPIPCCCWRYRPTKAYFMYTIKWAVLQYVIIRPACSIAGIICQAFNVLCDSGPFRSYYADVYLEVIDFVSISIALYGLILFYGLTKEELKGRRPLAKFLAIKLIVMFTFYQSFVFDALEGHVIKPTKYWTATNIADGLNALTICIEMVIFSLFMMWAYTSAEYRIKDAPKTSIWRPLWDSLNFSDFVLEIYRSLKFYIDYARGKSSARSDPRPRGGIVNSYKKMDFGEAFGVNGTKYPKEAVLTSRDPSTTRPRGSEEIHLTPYPRR